MLWFFLSIAVLAGSPLGRAIAERVTGRRTPDGSEDDLAEIEWMEQRVEERIADLEERLDFAERLLNPPPDDRTQMSV